MFARILEIAPSPEKKQELIYALNQEIVPILKEQPDFVETLAFLPENKSDRILSITFWTEKRFAEKYAKEAYPKVEQIMKPFLAIPITVKTYTVESVLSKRFVGGIDGRSTRAYIASNYGDNCWSTSSTRAQDGAQRMIFPHPLLRRHITEDMTLLLISSAHAFSYHMRLWIRSRFQQPVWERFG